MKKIIDILICTLMITTAFPAVESLKNSAINSTVPSTPLTSMAGWIEKQKLLASDGAASDFFGRSVSLNNDAALIGAPYDNDNGHWSGSAYVFTRTGTTTWTQQAKILASDGAAEDWFGLSVCLDGDTALIGAAADDKSRGSAYVFTRTGTSWTQQAKLLASDGTARDIFGVSVSLSGDTALIGADGDSDNGDASGSVYVFTRTGTTWTQQAKILASDGASGNWFGYSVSLSGDTALIGAPRDYNNGVDERGSAYVFTRTGTSWTQQTKLLASDGAVQGFFGGSVFLDGGTALIGAFWDDDNGDASGSAYVFARTGTTWWTQQQKLLASDGSFGDSFGVSVSLDGNTALIGAFYDDDNGDASGSAYVFTRTGTSWTQQKKLLASDGATGDGFGRSVSLSGDTALIGAFYDDDNGGNSGSAYVFTKESGNQPPNLPTISGEANGKINVEYTYTSSTTDPDGDQVSYWFDWGDGTNSGWVGPYASGATGSAKHKWSVKGTYQIKVKAKDIYGDESDWATLSVTMPKSYSYPDGQSSQSQQQSTPQSNPMAQQSATTSTSTPTATTIATTSTATTTTISATTRQTNTIR